MPTALSLSLCDALLVHSVGDLIEESAVVCGRGSACYRGSLARSQGESASERCLDFIQWRAGAVTEFALVQPPSFVGVQAERVFYTEHAQERGSPQCRQLSMPSSVEMLRYSTPEIYGLSQVTAVPLTPRELHCQLR